MQRKELGCKLFVEGKTQGRVRTCTWVFVRGGRLERRNFLRPHFLALTNNKTYVICRRHSRTVQSHAAPNRLRTHARDRTRPYTCALYTPPQVDGVPNTHTILRYRLWIIITVNRGDKLIPPRNGVLWSRNENHTSNIQSHLNEYNIIIILWVQ